MSKGDERLLAFNGRTGWHFLRNDKGLYAGHHPADSAAAIAALSVCGRRRPVPGVPPGGALVARSLPGSANISTGMDALSCGMNARP